MNNLESKPRPKINFSFVDLPPRALQVVASTLQFGRDKGYKQTWNQCGFMGNNSYFNHGLGHIFKAMQLGVGTDERILQLSKVCTNFLIQLEKEILEKERLENGYKRI